MVGRREELRFVVNFAWLDARADRRRLAGVRHHVIKVPRHRLVSNQLNQIRQPFSHLVASFPIAPPPSASGCVRLSRRQFHVEVERENRTVQMVGRRGCRHAS